MREHEHWQMIALEDLDSAKHLFTQSFITTLFHVQQCAEKALKSYVVLKRGSVKKTHDLIRLIEMCMEIDKKFEALYFFAAEINPYETAGRYPDENFNKPSQERMKELINYSEYMFNFVTDLITQK
jgi:HEPN domain-containing protein